MQVQAILARTNALPPTFKALLAAAIVLAVVGSIAVTMASHGARVPLFSARLYPEQLADVEERLAEWNVAFTPVADNVVVDAARRNDLLLRLSLAGVPHPHVQTTTEALSSVGLLTPQSVIDAQTRTGLAGEIELALRSVEGIDDARVIIAPAKAAEFADQQAHDATASVRVRLRAGTRLSRTSVDGIRAFVAASVPGLSLAHVTLLDDRGVALGTRPSGDDAPELQASLQSALDQALGSGTAIVRISAEYSSAEREAREDRRAPAGAPIVSRATRETYDARATRYEKNETNDDRGSDVRSEVSRVPAGTLLRLSTAVFVDESRASELASVRALAAAAVGFRPQRGDTLTVQAVNFHHAIAARADGWMLLYGALAPLLPTLAVVLGLIVSARVTIPHLAGALERISERSTIARKSREVAGFAPARVRGALANEPPHAAAAVISALPAATAAAVLELYPQHEREAIVARMQRAHSPFVPDAAEVLGHA